MANIGIDIIEINRIKKAIQRFEKTFLSKIFTEKEQAYCEQFKSLKYEKYAARFAVKEAVAKVIQEGPKHFWTYIEVDKKENGAPTLNLLGPLENEGPIQISLSHCKDYAVGIANRLS